MVIDGRNDSSVDGRFVWVCCYLPAMSVSISQDFGAGMLDQTGNALWNRAVETEAVACRCFLMDDLCLAENDLRADPVNLAMRCEVP